MNITEISLSIKNLVKGFKDDAENGVVAWDGKLDVRPPYQREFIYTADKQEKVIDTIIKDYPLNVFYWGTTNIDGYYELIDGQQRTMSICRFVTNMFSIKYGNQDYTFSSLPSDIQKQILDYELKIYKCEGDDDDKLEWFKTINIASEALTEQELRNAVYTGTWLSSAKQYFSKTNCPADTYGKGFIKGRAIRQELLEKVLRWAASAKNQSIENYMAIHRNDADASALWDYYTKVIDWVKALFGGENFRDTEKINWGLLYNKYSSQHYLDNNNNINCFIDGTANNYSKAKFVQEMYRLLDDDEITSTTGIYDYIFSGDERKLSIRTFPDKIKQKVYRKQEGRCKHCGRPFDYEDMVGDHIDPWSKGGKTVEGNCQLLCVTCNARKSNKNEGIDVLNSNIKGTVCSNCGKPVEKGRFCTFCGTKN